MPSANPGLDPATVLTKTPSNWPVSDHWNQTSVALPCGFTVPFSVALPPPLPVAARVVTVGGARTVPVIGKMNVPIPGASLLITTLPLLVPPVVFARRVTSKISVPPEGTRFGPVPFVR